MSRAKLQVVSNQPTPGHEVTVEQEAARWSDQVLACRSLMHAWEQRGATYSKRYRYYSVEMTCIRCGTVKHQELDGRGRITASWYTYPEGYLSAAGFLDSDARATVRVANLERGNLRTLRAGTAPTHKATRSAGEL